MKISRRDFIKSGTFSLVGGLFILPNAPSLVRDFVSTGETVGIQPDFSSIADSHYWRFVVDIKKCIGCGACLRACKQENNVPLEPDNNRTWVERYVFTEKGEILVDSPNAGIDGFKADYMNLKYQNLKIRKSFFVPKLCNHCDKPPCVPVCPVGANYISKEGVVLVNKNACIGCRYCIQACPYGARYFDRAMRVVDKCSWCYHRITKGLLPACVEACPRSARLFGDIRDSNSEVSRIIREQPIGVLKPEIGCNNKVFYVGLENGVR